jgi:hypothetical protein
MNTRKGAEDNPLAEKEGKSEQPHLRGQAVLLRQVGFAISEKMAFLFLVQPQIW